ncbi:Hypothetical predicted protein [Olea europaea subsp. europaea]|uniref:Uncharacterized protein n=1 Tax=Olea europaea subsp. europaea TaxID=158383 RepID=A0A8S0RMC2_OLEEU|nr:Hypothetical predicted protein [Olea europaea subsp. europaea]
MNTMQLCKTHFCTFFISVEENSMLLLISVGRFSWCAHKVLDKMSNKATLLQIRNESHEYCVSLPSIQDLHSPQSLIRAVEVEIPYHLRYCHFFRSVISPTEKDGVGELEEHMLDFFFR